MLSKVISGGQVGADIAGLRAAKNLGIETGGYAPKGWMTLSGPKQTILSSYGLTECQRKGYPARTELNVKESDATILLARDWNSPGEICTLKFIDEHRKPHINVAMQYVPDGVNKPVFDTSAKYVAHWIIMHEFDVINIAGNAFIMVENDIEQYLSDVFYRVLDYKNAEVPDE